MRDITARFEVPAPIKEKINIPLVAKQVFRLFKDADRTCRLMPFFGNENEDISSIDQEDAIPDEEKEIKQYVDNPRFVNEKLFFNVRISSMRPMKHMKDSLIPWMQKNLGFVRLDTLRCRDIHAVGCIVDFHTTLHNRHTLKEHVKNELLIHGYKGEFNMYARNVWNNHLGNKVVTRAMVIEVDKVNKDFAIDALIGVNFGRQYKDAKFIPFNKAQFPGELMNKILSSNNDYHNKMKRRKISGLGNVNDIQINRDGQEISIQEWMHGIKNEDGDYLFDRVEQSAFGESVIIFDERMNNEINFFLNEFNEKECAPED